MFSNRNLITPLDGSTMARRVCSHRLAMPFSCAAAKLLMIVFLIVIENVSHISSQQLLTNIAMPSSSDASDASNFGSLYPPSVDTIQHLPLSDTHRLAKRMDLEACLGQFDIHTNTIIRTGDSQAIGGKFLQGLELDTIEQCQRLCCETDSCDVYIFESKNGSYCYLFECGPPENFHCKFTRHSNFTSAVLTPIKRFVDVTTTPRPPPTSPPQHTAPSISQQERELTSLKIKPEKLSELAAGLISGAIGNNVQTQQQQIGQQQMEIGFPQKVIVNNNSTPHCGRFQFACHSGECIAVYNACDGIPQCEDGSDEGPECSAASQSTAKGNVESTNINPSSVDATAQKYRPPLMQQTPQQQLQTMQQQQRQASETLNSASVNNREDANAWANRKIVTETQQTGGSNTVDLNSHIFTHKNGLQLPHNLGGIENTNNGASNTGAIDLNTGIGSYPNSNGNLNPMYTATIQRSGIYLPQAAVPQQQTDGLYTIPHQPLMSQHGHIYGPANMNWAQQQQQQQQQQTPQQFPAVVTPLTISNERGTSLAQGPAYVISTQEQAAPNFSHQQIQQQQHQPPKTPYLTPVIANNVLVQTSEHLQQQQQHQVPAVSSSNDGVALHEISQPQKTGEASKGSTKKALGTINNDSYEEDYEDESTEPPKKKLRKHKKVKSKSIPNAVEKEVANQSNKVPIDDDPVQQAMAQRKQTQSQPPSPVHEQYKMIHENLAMEFRDHDGQSDRPGGAVLSLTLGIIVTAALAILIGCRMRTVGRRARRLGGKTPYSHEADFLVNGMYL